MKFTVKKTFDINLNVEKIVRDFGYTDSTPKEEIIQQIHRFLALEDDVIYYSITAEEVYEGYKDEFKRAFEAQKKIKRQSKKDVKNKKKGSTHL